MPAAAARGLAVPTVEWDPDAPGVTGEQAAASAFASAWCELSGKTAPVVVAMRQYRLGRLVPPESIPGETRVAGPADLPLVVDWMRAFHTEAQPHQPDEDSSSLARSRLEAGELNLWVDDGCPVSMAACSSPVAGVARVGPVYTPPSRRQVGYGAAVTAAASQRALDEGATYVILYTDLANPTSNSVYQRIGYAPDHDASEHLFL
jgi:predicted GNAT family acetyltransferase